MIGWWDFIHTYARTHTYVRVSLPIRSCKPVTYVCVDTRLLMPMKSSSNVKFILSHSTPLETPINTGLLYL